MTDTVSKEKRSAMMSRIRGKNTLPELRVRSLLHRMGFRFRLHVADLPGKPDIVLPRYKTVIFVHGCFWHQHEGCRQAYTPSSNTDFWRNKLSLNTIRDKQTIDKLSEQGWHSVVVWECETSHEQRLRERLAEIVSSFSCDRYQETPRLPHWGRETL